MNITKNRFNFTQTAINELQPPTDKPTIEYYDLKVPALQLRVTRAGVKTFSFYRWVKATNRPERIKIGQYPYMPLEEARKKAREYTTQAESGYNPNAPIQDLKNGPTFDEFFAIWLERYAKKQKKTWKSDEGRYKKYIKNKSFGRMKMIKITRAHVSTLHHDASKGLKGGGANRVLALVSVVFTYAIEWGYCTHNPALGIRRYKESSRDRYLTKDEIGAFMQALDAFPHPIMRGFFFMCLFTGARRANVMAMRWKDINKDISEWRIQETKNGLPQVVPLVPQAREVLLGLKNKSEWVFPADSKAGHIQEPRKAWEALLKDAKIDGLRIHDLRRTIGSWQAITGTSLHIIGKSLNHKTAASTQVYARLSVEPVRESMAKAVDEILRHVKPQESS